MEILPAQPQPLRTSSGAARGTRTPSTAASSATSHSASKSEQAPASADDLALIAQQAAFDSMVKGRAELEREANALRDLAMAQLKRDDQNMALWIKMI